MLLVCSSEQAGSRRRTVDVHGQPYVLSEYVGSAPARGVYVEGNEANDNDLPQGFLVDQPPGSITRPHFHEADQFQVFVAGDGRVGKRPTRPVTVQFAGAHTPYGPIVAGAAGVRYFTLRQRWDPGAKYMPQMRAHLVRGRQRQRLTTDVRLDDPHGLATRRGAAVEWVIAPEADGLLGALLRLGPGACTETPTAGHGAGQYHIVVGGSMVHAGETLTRWSVQFASPREGPVPITAGTGGLELLVLRFPRR